MPVVHNKTTRGSNADVAQLRLLPKLLIAILSGALLAAATAQALEMLHH